MKQVASVFIFLSALYFYILVSIWLVNSFPAYVSIPVIWVSASVGAAFLWYRFRKNQPKLY
jgi:hypothetical protein